MGANTAIEWASHTFNPWLGCTKVSAGCDHCYAEEWGKRYGRVEWGEDAERVRTSKSYWMQPHKWNAEAEREGVRKRVFCASLADVFDARVPANWHRDLWYLIEATPHLDWLLLTKRIGRARHVLPADWFTKGHYNNVWLGITAENQQRYNNGWYFLSKINAVKKFISYEPALGPLTVSTHSEWWRTETPIGDNLPDWVICGGESGPHARPMNPQWARDIRNECVGRGIPFFFKQWGEWVSVSEVAAPGQFHHFPDGRTVRRAGKKKAGRTLDGVTWNQIPERSVFA